MINLIKKIILIIFIPIFLYSCQTAKDALTGKKRSKQGDEFLVKKKNPLSMPPDFEELPTPKSMDEENIINKNETSEIKSLLKLEESKNIQNNDSLNLQESILKKIN